MLTNEVGLFSTRALAKSNSITHKIEAEERARLLDHFRIGALLGWIRWRRAGDRLRPWPHPRAATPCATARPETPL